MRRSYLQIRSLTVFMTLATAVFADGCATTSAPQNELSYETHYTLRRGDAVVHPKPLPVETPILVDHFKSDGTQTTSVGFRGWDFSGHGQFGMIEVLNEDGSVQARLFDFDEDGRPELVRRSAEK